LNYGVALAVSGVIAGIGRIEGRGWDNLPKRRKRERKFANSAKADVSFLPQSFQYGLYRQEGGIA